MILVLNLTHVLQGSGSIADLYILPPQEEGNSPVHGHDGLMPHQDIAGLMTGILCTSIHSDLRTHTPHPMRGKYKNHSHGSV